MKIVRLNSQNRDKIAKLAQQELKKGHLLVIPSDTVYVLAANAKNDQAVKKIYQFKGRKFGKGISIFLNKINLIKSYAQFNKDQERIIKTLLPGAFTVILKSKGKTSRFLEPNDQTLGIRVVDHPFIRQLTKQCPFPITATSANISSRGPHYSIEAFIKTIPENKKSLISLIIDAGKLPKRPPSTVVRLVKSDIEILRKGSLEPKLILKRQTKSEAETKRLAQQIYQQYLSKNIKTKPSVVILKGDLGVGKTVFAKGIGDLFGQQMISPTFVLIDEHKINSKNLSYIYHLDLYRLEQEQELVDLNLKRLIKPKNLILIEWGEKLSILPKLKENNGNFFLIQITELSKNKREVCFYKI